MALVLAVVFNRKPNAEPNPGIDVCRLRVGACATSRPRAVAAEFRGTFCDRAPEQPYKCRNAGLTTRPSEPSSTATSVMYLGNGNR
jgi:hypothetical protein